MTTKHKSSAQSWRILGGPQAGTAAALGIGKENGTTFFIGTNVGLFRSTGFDGDAILGWERLPAAPVGILSIAVSPHFAEDHTLLAGTNTGIFTSHDRGETWQSAPMPMTAATILAFCFSPDYSGDSIVMAGTLEDGLFYSDTRGNQWVNRSFGLFDPAVFSLAMSPNFARDGKIFAGTDTAVYYSYNAGRAWKPLPFPEEAAPALSLAISPGFPEDHTLYAGTETHGMYRSTDEGQSWEKLDLPAASINVLIDSEPAMGILAATGAGIFQSLDKGKAWKCLYDLPEAISLAAGDGLAITGAVDRGVWTSTDLEDWRPIPGLSARSLLGMALSPGIGQDGMAFLFGPQEGIWRTADGGETWACLNETLPTLDIQELILMPEFPVRPLCGAAAPEGLFLSENGGDTWKRLAGDPVERLAFSPNGKLLAASFTGEGLRVSEDLGKSWQNVKGSWGVGGRILSLSVSNAQTWKVAHLEGMGEVLNIWQGKTGQLEKVLSRPVVGKPVVSFWIPAGPAADRPWYVGLGNEVWKISSRVGAGRALYSHPFPNAQNENILSLDGVQGPSGTILFASTGRYIYRSMDGQTWSSVHDFGNDRAVSFALSPSYLEDKTAYALLLGGSFSKGAIK